MPNLSEMAVKEAVTLAFKTLIYGRYEEAKGPQKYGEPFTGSFEEFFDYQFGDYTYWDDESEETVSLSLKNLDNDRVWEHFHSGYNGKEGFYDGWTAKVEKSHGGEGQGDQYWMVISLSDNLGHVRYFRKDGWYASYDGGYLDGDTYEVEPVEKTVVFYE